MNTFPAVPPVWINANPSFKHFDARLVRYMSNRIPIAYWEYHQDLDEASSLDVALVLLHDYLKTKSEPVDLIGHATGGLLGLLYARKYPHRVKSLTLLGVGSAPSIDWQAHYYQMRKLLPCSQDVILSRMIKMMFGYQSRRNVANLIKILKQDLVTAPTSHSLYQIDRIKAGGVSMPLMVCGSKQDGIVDRSSLQGWSNYLKDDDRLLTVPEGHHFFHYFFPEDTGKKIIKFWQQLNQPSSQTSEVSLASEICYHYF
ncbi:MAG: alpha/beta hydrolase [Cyanobacteria bacterium J06623_7]